jgi:hypothetical protein
LLTISGKISDKDGMIKLLADDAKIFKPITSNDRTCVITLPSTATPTGLTKLKELLALFPGAERVTLLLEGAKTKTIETNFQITDTPKFRKELENILDSMR